MTEAGSGNLGPVGDKAGPGDTTAGMASAAAANGVAPGQILVLGECLADLAPAGGTPEDLLPGRAAGRRAGGATGAAPGATIREVVGATGPSGRDQARQNLVALPGGGPANIAVGLARLGAPCTFAGRFSRGGFGPWLRRNLVDNGVDLSFSVDADEPATIALVTLDSHGRASYTFYGPTTADWQWAPSELPDLGGQHHGGRAVKPAVKAVHTGSLVLALEPGAGAITGWLGDLRQNGRVLISFDPNVRPGFVGDLAAYRDRLTEVVRNSHVVRASSEDVEAVYPGAPLRAAAEKWLSLGAALVVITEGPDGATAFREDGATVHCDPPPVELADTIGAGDAFTAALLAYFGDHGLLDPSRIAHLDEAQLRAAVTQAVAGGSLTCSRVGADPPSRAQLDRFLADQG